MEENILSIKEENKILVDSREDQKILLLLQKENIPYKVVTLPIGDYCISDVVFERKTIVDFINSMKGHLQEQINNALENSNLIKHFIIILIGDFEELFWKHIIINQNSFYGMLSSITMKYKFSIIHFKKEIQFIHYLKYCLEKSNNNTTINFIKVKKLEFKDNTELSLLCALPNISITKAQKILEKFKIKLILTDKENNGKIIEELKELDGIGNKIIEKIRPYFLQ